MYSMQVRDSEEHQVHCGLSTCQLATVDFHQLVHSTFSKICKQHVQCVLTNVNACQPQGPHEMSDGLCEPRLAMNDGCVEQGLPSMIAVLMMCWVLLSLTGYLLTSLTAYMSAASDSATSNTICPTQARECGLQHRR
jgi:hypothetical protein